MIKKHYFNLAGVTHYKDAIKEATTLNDDYDLSKKELFEEYDVGDRVFKYIADAGKFELVPEPENEYDPNAIRADAFGKTIGYIKKKETATVRELMASPFYKGVYVDEICIGEYKELDEDEDGKPVIYTEAVEYPSVTIAIYIDEPVTETVVEEPKKRGRSVLGTFAMVVGVFVALVGILLVVSQALPDGVVLLLIGAGLVLLSRFARK